MIVDIKSSKTVKNGKVHQIPVAQGENKALFPVYSLEEIHKLFLGSKKLGNVSYSDYNSELKKLP